MIHYEISNAEMEEFAAFMTSDMGRIFAEAVMISNPQAYLECFRIFKNPKEAYFSAMFYNFKRETIFLF